MPWFDCSWFSEIKCVIPTCIMLTFNKVWGLECCRFENIGWNQLWRPKKCGKIGSKEKKCVTLSDWQWKTLSTVTITQSLYLPAYTSWLTNSAFRRSLTPTDPKLKFLNYYCIYMSIVLIFLFSGCMSVNHVHDWCLWGPEEGVRSLELEFLMVVGLLWVLGLEPGSSIKTVNALNSWAPAQVAPIFVEHLAKFLEKIVYNENSLYGFCIVGIYSSMLSRQGSSVTFSVDIWLQRKKFNEICLLVWEWS